jgi:hypothetical protein
LLISNGYTAVNSSYQVIPGADTLATGDGFLLRYYVSGNPIDQGSILISSSESDSVFKIINLERDTNQYPTVIGKSNVLKIAKIDLRLNGGFGGTVYKDRLMGVDTFSSGRLQAVKHANGKDWWVIVPRFYSNCYIKYLIEADTIKGPMLQCIGPVMEGNNDIGAAGFSRDGSLYATCIDPLTQRKPPLVIMNFDRCTGEFYNFRSVDGNDSLHTTRCYGVSFSLNNRFITFSARRSGLNKEEFFNMPTSMAPCSMVSLSGVVLK